MAPSNDGDVLSPHDLIELPDSEEIRKRLGLVGDLYAHLGGEEGAPLVRVKILDDGFQAELVHDALTQEHIPHLVQSYRDTALDGIYQTVMGWGCVITIEEHAEQAKIIIEEVLSATVIKDDDAEEDG